MRSVAQRRPGFRGSRPDQAARAVGGNRGSDPLLPLQRRTSSPERDLVFVPYSSFENVGASARTATIGSLSSPLSSRIVRDRERRRTDDGERLTALAAERAAAITRWRSAILEEVPARPAPAEVNPAMQEFPDLIRT